MSINYLDVEEPRRQRSTSRNPGREPKIRTACDACSFAKVRCNKEQPNCQRCIAGGLRCIYSPSQRKGKPAGVRGRSTSNANLRQSEDSMYRQRPTMQHSYSTPLVPQTAYNANPQQPFSTPFSTPMQELQNPFTSSWVPENNSMLTVDTYQWTGFTATNTFNGFPTDFDFQDFVCEEDIQALSPCEVSEFPAAINNAFANSPEHINPKHDCSALAFSTLASLHIRSDSLFTSLSRSNSLSPRSSPRSDMSSSTSSSSSSNPPSLDQVLRNNKAAIANLTTLLECPCSLDPHLALLYASITSKIIAWYQAARKSDTASTSLSTESVSHMPITLGAFSLDKEDEARMRCHLLLGEVQKLDKLIDRFADRFAGIDDASGTGVYAALGDCIRSRVKSAVEDLSQV